MHHCIAELAKLLGLRFQGDGTHVVTRVSNWEEADASSLIFNDGKMRTAAAYEVPCAGCLIAPEELLRPGWNAIISAHPKLDFARASAYLEPRPAGTGIRQPSAIVDISAFLSRDIDVGAGVIVGPRCRIGRRCILHAGVVIGEDCVLGDDCILHPRVVLYPGVQLGSRVTLHAGAVIGSDGFGYVFDGQQQVKFPQAGGVLIEDDVEVGANTTIDRGSLGSTRIGTGAKIDNLVQIAHNVQIGRGVVIAAQTGISGSTVIEDFAVIGGQVGFGDHARVESGAVIGSKAGVLPGKIVRGGEVYWGVPVRPLKEYKKLNALFGKLPEMKEKIEQLEKRLEKLRQEGTNYRDHED
jgi:UDP-3-O-[3-hydroxymyristoyl] glucosamine N-acyltransferase